jgi:enolase-phosphatase E1
LDVEGTTTPISFVSDVLFPYARAHLREFLRSHIDRRDVSAAVGLLSEEWRRDAAIPGRRPQQWRDDTMVSMVASATAYLEWLMEVDRKSPGLKLIQGYVWEGGFHAGVLRGAVFPDVAPALKRWRAEHIEVAIFSSGSVLAQKLLFSTTQDGDLTPLIDAYFDTATGPKTAPDSYTRISEAMRQRPERLLFVSDAEDEIVAARTAGCQALLSVRPGNRAQAAVEGVERIDSLAEIA